MATNFEERYFDELKDKLDKMEGKIDTIQSKVNYMYAFAAGIGFVVSLAWSWLSNKFFPH